MATHRSKVLLGITQSNFGGAQRNVYDLATGLKDQCDVVVVYGGEGVLAQKLREAGIRSASLSSMVRQVGFLGELRSLRALIALIKKERPDVLHVHSTKMGGLGVVAGRLCGVPRIIFTSHGWEFNAPRPWWQRRIIGIVSTFIVLLSHETIAVSEALKKDILFKPAREKMTIVHNAIGPISFKEKNEARQVLRHMDATLEDGTWVGTVAELHPVKGLRWGLEAIGELTQKYPNLQYVVMGEGKERANLEKLIQEKGLEKSVHLLGFVRDVPTLLRAFDVYVHPSLSEAFSYALLEVGSAGLPTVATRVGGIPEIITDQKDGILVPSKDATALARAIESLLNDRSHAQNLGDALHERVAKDFSLQTMLSQIKKVYGM